MSRWIKGLLITAVITGVLGATLFAGVYFTTGKSSVTSSDVSGIDFHHNELLEEIFDEADIKINMNEPSKNNNNGSAEGNNTEVNKNNSSVAASNNGQRIEETYDRLDTLIINAEHAEITVRSSNKSDISLNATAYGHSSVNAKMNNGVLTITTECTEECINHKASDKIVVTIPTGLKLVNNSIICKTGEIDITAGIWINTDIECESGDIDIENREFEGLNVLLLSGDFDYSGKAYESFDVEVNAGEIDIDLKQNINNVSYSLSNKSGQIKVNDRKVEKDSSNSYIDVRTEAECSMNVVVNAGEIDIDFK